MYCHIYVYYCNFHWVFKTSLKARWEVLPIALASNQKIWGWVQSDGLKPSHLSFNGIDLGTEAQFLYLLCCASLDKLSNTSEPPFAQLWKDDHNDYFLDLLMGWR